jgi:hypothetical protein
MKYICLGYYDKGKHEAMTEGEQHAMFDANIFEIRPAADMNEIMKTSEQRRRQTTAR